MTLPAIVWRPSPYKNLRDPRYPIRGVVSHRIVGTLPSARAAFGVAPGTPRNASTHFGIGYDGGRLAIDQYVDLSDMAWGNGDVREPTWVFYQPGVNPNLTTVSIEHEDGGSANRGRVSDAVWAASIALQVLITSGDAKRIRAAGIRVRFDETARQLAALPKDSRAFIDHNQISGPNKPYCFRRWLDDPGFVEGTPSRRDRLLAALNGQEDDVNEYLKGAEFIKNRTARLRSGATARSAPRFDPKNYDGWKRFTIDKDSSGPAVAWVNGTNLTLANGTVFDASTRWLATWNADHGIIFWHGRDVIDLVPAEQIDPTALQAALDAANTRTASVKTEAARLIRVIGKAVSDVAAGAEAAARNVEKL